MVVKHWACFWKCQRRYRFLWGLLCLSSSWLLTSSDAIALFSWQFNPETYQLQVRTEGAIAPDLFILKNPTRIVIDFPETQLDRAPVSQQYSGLVREMRMAQFQPEITRIVLELSPEAQLVSETVSLEKTATSQGYQWQVTPTLAKISFPRSQLMQLPPIERDRAVSPKRVQVPSPPSIAAPSPSQPTELKLAIGTQFRLRYRGENPLTLKVEEPWQEILFLEEKLTTEEGELIAPAQTPVIGRFKTTPEGTRFIAQGLVTTLRPVTASSPYPVVQIQARSSLFPESTASPLTQVTIPPNTVFTLELTEAWHYRQ